MQTQTQCQCQAILSDPLGSAMLNHILVLPNLVKFCEICESRDQVKWIKDRALRLQEQVAMDDTIW
ncbi:GL22915 [Drosophila persimilis]|uniref:GL21032 n=1 Tax=Drosophila persimilis TaxID=7234 RepID=B4IQZ6_DROPE|nr:GL21032 [Drosophila persimilis]EDW27420.1 GL22915 [Drosophila persimilis]